MYGLENGFEFWWIFPLLCILLMVLCMGGRGWSCCGAGRRRSSWNGWFRESGQISRNPADNGRRGGSDDSDGPRE